MQPAHIKLLLVLAVMLMVGLFVNRAIYNNCLRNCREVAAP